MLNEKTNFKKLVDSIKEFPEMIETRPLVVDENMMVLGGNMRLKALQKIGYNKITVEVVSDWSEQKKREFIIKDNVNYGDWDFDLLANEWDFDLLKDWGLNVNIDEHQTEFLSKNILAPDYTPRDVKPDIKYLFDDRKYKKLIKEIENSILHKDDKEFLKISALRHIVFNYENIADYYSHSDKKTQKLMEKSALVIIDLKNAIKNGFVDLSYEFKELYSEEN